MSRLMLIQLVLFVVVALGCAYFMVTDVFGSHIVRTPFEVTVRMPDTGGLSVGSQVTYRGVDTGKVSDLRIADEGNEVVVTVSLDADSRIPADAPVAVVMDTPLAILHLDFQPHDDSGPYLTEGDVITTEQTRRPLPLETLLEDFMRLADSLPAEDAAAVGQALATGLGGTSAELTQIMDNTHELLDLAQDRTPQIERIIENGTLVAGTSGRRIRALTSAMSSLSGSLRDTEPELQSLLHEVPESTRQVTDLVQEAEPEFTTLLGNLVTTSQLVSMRVPALEQLATSVPESLTKLGSIVEGDTAQFYLVGALGPVCYNDTERRTPQQVESRTPEFTYHCTPEEDLSQRGAMNAPRPDSTVTTPAPDPPTYNAATGETAPFQLGATGGQADVLGPRSWSSLLLQGVQ